MILLKHNVTLALARSLQVSKKCQIKGHGTHLIQEYSFQDERDKRMPLKLVILKIICKLQARANAMLSSSNTVHDMTHRLNIHITMISM